MPNRVPQKGPSTLTYTDTTGGNTHDDNYIDQFQVTFRVVPGGAGSTVPTGTVWMDYGSDPISASSNAGSAFSLWSSVGSIVIGSPSSAFTTATVTGNGTIEASYATLISDTFSFSDAPSEMASIARSASDAYSFVVSDIASSFVSLTRNAPDSFVLSDQATAGRALIVAANDVYSFSESASRGMGVGIAVSDAFQYLDTAQLIEYIPKPLAGQIIVIVVDKFPFTDAPSHFGVFVRAAADAVGFVDSVSRALGLTRAAVDG